MPANLENSAVATGLEKVSFHSIPKKGNAKECSDYHTIAFISFASNVMLKILQARLQHYVNIFQMFKLDLEKAEDQEIQLPVSVGSLTKQENSRKISISDSLTTLKLLTIWITTNWKILKSNGDTRPPYLPPEKSVCRSRSNS